MKKILIATAIGIIAIASLSHNTEAPIVEADAKDITTKEVANNTYSETTDEDEHAYEEQENETKSKVEQDTAERLYLGIMRENLGSYVDVQFNEIDKIYTMTPTDPNLIDEIIMLSAGIGHESWAVLVDGMVGMSESGRKELGEGYSMTLVNPLNHENIILWIMDGEVIYNVIDDL